MDKTLEYITREQKMIENFKTLKEKSITFQNLLELYSNTIYAQLEKMHERRSTIDKDLEIIDEIIKYYENAENDSNPVSFEKLKEYFAHEVKLQEIYDDLIKIKNDN